MSRSPGYQVRRRAADLEPDQTRTGLAGPAEEAAAETPPAPAAGASAPGRPEAEAAGGAGPMAAAQVAGAGAGGRRPARSGRLRSAAHEAPALALVAALGLAGTAGFGLAWAFDRGNASPTPGVLSASRNVVLALTNFDPGTIKSDFAQIRSDATGGFASQARRFFGTRIQGELKAANAASRGTVQELYVQSVSGGRATVFAVVSQRYLNKDASAPVNDTLRLVIGLTDIGGSWKTSSVQVLQQPVSAGGGSPVTGGTGARGSASRGRSKSAKSGTK